MSIDFNLQNFAYPLSIIKLHSQLDKSQWFSEQQMEALQINKLRKVLLHAYINVPYYKALFDRLHFSPQDVKTLQDLKQLPVLTKEGLAKHSGELMAKNAARYKPVRYRTSGTSGTPVEFCLDKSANVLEFCYYWRYWSWAGYRLRDSFAELASHDFIKKDILDKHKFIYDRLSKRLQLNIILLSSDTIGEYADMIRRKRPLFLKGMASSLYIFSVLLRREGITDISFKAAFSTGEMLLEPYRKTIEEVLHCKVHDSYGHMERTVAVSECPCGGYHINSDYGILELDAPSPQPGSARPDKVQGTVIGTSLHNFCMPLIRYEVGDLISIDRAASKCECGRGLPLIAGIHGRVEDHIVTPDGRTITSLYTVFKYVEHIELGQFIQESPRKLHLRIVRGKHFTEETERRLLGLVEKFVGSEMRISIEYNTLEAIRGPGTKKFKVVSSQAQENV